MGCCWAAYAVDKVVIASIDSSQEGTAVSHSTQRDGGGGKAERRHGHGTNYNTIQQLLCGWTTLVPIKLFGSCRLSRGERPIGSPMMIETRSWRRRSREEKGKEATRFSNGIGLD